MSRINRIKFSKIKTGYDILKMKSAYILAEQAIVQDQSLTGWVPNPNYNEYVPLPPRDVELKEMKKQLNELEETGRRLLAEEKYELMQEANELWSKINKIYQNLKNGRI